MESYCQRTKKQKQNSLSVNPLFIPVKLHFPSRWEASRDNTHQYHLGELGNKEILWYVRLMTQIQGCDSWVEKGCTGWGTEFEIRATVAKFCPCLKWLCNLRLGLQSLGLSFLIFKIVIKSRSIQLIQRPYMSWIFRRSIKSRVL